MKVYVAGPMQGYKSFNFPAFFEASAALREFGHSVFCPAERDIEKYGPAIMSSETGNLDDVKDLGFSLREALAADTQFICLHADAIYMLLGWEKSGGARAEHALSVALGHRILYQQVRR